MYDFGLCIIIEEIVVFFTAAIESLNIIYHLNKWLRIIFKRKSYQSTHCFPIDFDPQRQKHEYRSINYRFVVIELQQVVLQRNKMPSQFIRYFLLSVRMSNVCLRAYYYGDGRPFAQNYIYVNLLFFFLFIFTAQNKTKHNKKAQTIVCTTPKWI